MLASTLVYVGLLTVVAGLVLLVRPVRRLRVPTRLRALAIFGAGVAMVAIALMVPASESRIGRVETRLDEFAPAWQFREVHTRRIAAPPARVFEAIKRVRPDEIFLFSTLIRIRSGGQPPSPDILNAAKRFESLIDIATHTTFVYLADDAPRELVVGTVVGWPPGTRGRVTPELFQQPLAAGFTMAAMNFLVTPDGAGGSVVSTETRVFANGAPARRRFAAYWRVIYPGSAIIRGMWLRAIERRATRPESGQYEDGLAARPAVTQRSPEGPPPVYPHCTYKENAFRGSVDAPKATVRAEPNLSGLPALTGESAVFVEVRISEQGRVTEDCLLRGVRPDVDARALAAARAWQFEPARLKVDVVTHDGKRLRAGTPVPIFMTLSVKVGT
jgi:hypothetical protein